MKFYRYNPKYNYLFKIINNNLIGIYSSFSVHFFKNGKLHNTKNAAIIYYNIKEFYLSGKYCGCEDDFTKQSWRKFVKLQAFI